MAVLDAHPGLKTQIVVNKRPLDEYDDEEAEAALTEVTKYIEARSGADFMIKTTFSEPFPANNGVEIKVKVDGNHGPCWAIKPDDRFYRFAKNMTGVSFTQDGKRYHQNYQFADLNIVEEVEGPLDFQALRNELELKGCIEVSYRWITNFRTRSEPEKRGNPQDVVAQPKEHKDANVDAPIPRRQLPSVGAIPEKALKGDARSHQAILGEPNAKEAFKGPSSSFDYVDREPFGIMRFKYRSSAALKALRVIVDPEPQLEPDPLQSEAPRMAEASPSRLPLLWRYTQNERETVKPETKPHNIKQEKEVQGSVKREHNATGDTHEDSDDLTVVETRRCKRSRAEQEVIMLE